MGNITFIHADHLHGAIINACESGRDPKLMAGMLRLLELCSRYVSGKPNRHAEIGATYSAINTPERAAVSFDFFIYDQGQT